MSRDALAAEQRLRLRDELCHAFDTWERVDAFRATTAGTLPDAGGEVGSVDEFWRNVVDRCESIADYRRLVTYAGEYFPDNRTFEAIAELLDGNRAAPAPAAQRTGRRPTRLLVVATEWSSIAGGLSTFNRRLCGALAAAGADVTCLVVDASEAETREAAEHGVRLVVAKVLPGLTPHEALSRRPALMGGPPDVVIGHGRITGPAAQVQYKDNFPDAAGVHLIHMAPDEIEWHKTSGTTGKAQAAESRTRIEVDLARSADLVAAIGPVLFERFRMELSGYDDCPRIIRLDPGFVALGNKPRQADGARLLRILLFGRLEDAELKGVDIAARAVSFATGFLPQGPQLELLVRGARDGQGDALCEAIHQWSGRPTMPVVPRSYTTDSVRLDADLRSSSLVLMPSRAEGFGLAGVEAIELGTPLLVSAASGLGRYLHEILPPDQAGRMVVDWHEDIDVAWGQEVLRVVRSRQAALDEAASLAQLLAARRPWSDVAYELLTEVGARV